MENNKSIASILESMGDLLNDLTVAADDLIEKHKEQKPVAGWYKYSDWSKFMSYRVDGKFIYGWGTTGIWLSDMTGTESSPCREYLADPKEVEQRLIEEAKRRGFKEGCRFVSSFDDNSMVRIWNRYDDETYSYLGVYGDPTRIRIHSVNISDRGCSDPLIFKDGKWSEIIPEPLTLNGKEVFVKNDRIHYADRELICLSDLHILVELSKKMTAHSINTFSFGEVKLEDLKQLLTKIEERENK